MTALDRSIIKAFRRPESRSGSAVAEPRSAAPRAAVSPAVPLSQALAELSATSAAMPEKRTSPAGRAPQEKATAKNAGSSPVIAAEPLSAPVGASIAALLDDAIHASTVSEATVTPIGPSFASWQNTAFQASTVTIEAPMLPETDAAAPADEADALASQLLTSPPTHTITISQTPAETPWRPLLQVDSVVWPSIHDRFQTTAPAAVEQMTEGLLSICASGSKVLGLASCASGEGVTTLLLAAARRLLGQGRKVVLVDANWSNPELARNLGLLPQIGWEETLGGCLPLEEVVIESLADGLAVLPLREPSANTIEPARIAASLETLAREFDVVLVDLGPLDQIEDEDRSSDNVNAWLEGTPSRYVAAQMDAVILVQNVRVTTPNRLAEARECLAASNLRHAGTIQNFVAG